MKTSKQCSFKRVLIALNCILLFSTVVFANNLSTFDELLSKIKTYDYGQSRENLSQLKESIYSALDSPETLKEFQSQMIDFLESDATFASKQFVCEQLSIIGDEYAATALVDLLQDSKTANIARFALERIPGEKVERALRKELSESSGMTKVGIINTLGQRRDRKAVKQLGNCVNDTDEQVAVATIEALGNIADENSAKILKNITTEIGRAHV